MDCIILLDNCIFRLYKLAGTDKNGLFQEECHNHATKQVIKMNDDAPLKNQWISSLDVINKTGISRATLNNYIKMNLLPRPAVKRPETTDARARMLGYFPGSVIDTIIQIKELKKQGFSMDAITGRLKESLLNPTIDSGIKSMQEETQSRNTRAEEEAVLPDESKTDTDANEDEAPPMEGPPSSAVFDSSRNALKVTISDIPCPAYLLNNNFEIDWVNPKAEKTLFQKDFHLMKEPVERNIFSLLLRNRGKKEKIKDILTDFHLRFVKEKIGKSNLDRLYEGMTSHEKELLEAKYDAVEPPRCQAINKMLLNLSDDAGRCFSDCVYYMVFREGTLFIHAMEANDTEGIANLLSSRTSVINDLLRQRMPTLVSFCVLVADLQNSVRICAELPPEEYFELINQIWACVEGTFKRYYGTYGKHTGDGLLYYFLKERDNQYMMNAISCALEIRKNIKKLNMDWKMRKGWFNELCLNIGINEGQEYFGTIPSSPNIEFTALGDTVNYAGRLSDFARFGAIWTTKNLINKLSAEDRTGLRYGIRHKDNDREILIENSFGRVMDMILPENKNSNKFMDIATLAITEIVEKR